MSDTVVIRTYSYRNEAEFYRMVLDGYGIQSIVSADDFGGVQPALALSGGVRLIVNVEDAAQASDILDQHEEEPVAGADEEPT